MTVAACSSITCSPTNTGVGESSIDLEQKANIGEGELRIKELKSTNECCLGITYQLSSTTGSATAVTEFATPPVYDTDTYVYTTTVTTPF